MAQVRNVLRGVAHRMVEPPAAVLIALEEAMEDLAVDALVTAILAKVEQIPEETDAGQRTLRWSNAGHPPPLHIAPNGDARLLATPADLLLGVRRNARRRDHTLRLDPGATVVFFTDGLVERRGVDLDDGLEQLRVTAEQAAKRRPALDDLCDALVAGLGGDYEDDVAVLAVRAGPLDRATPLQR